MDAQLFSTSPVGHVVPISGWDTRRDEAFDHFAYIPDPLSTEVQLTQDTIRLMGEADRALGSLDARIRFLPNPALLVQPALKKEAQATSALEGTYAHLEDVLKAEHIEAPKRSSEVREILNYVDAAMQAIDMLKDIPICKRLLEPIQKTLVRGTQGDGYDAGKLRERQVFIGEEGAPVAEARFVPPPPGEPLITGFSDWERWINTENGVPLLAKLAMAHYQFETLHPFSDGNGRIGRLVITLQLLAGGELEYPILNLSAWFEPRRQQYIDALRQVTLTGNFDSWIAMFATAVRDRSRAALQQIDALLGYRDSVIQRAERASVRGISAESVDPIIGHPYITVSEYARLRGCAYGTARSIIDKFVTLDVLQSISSGYNQIFWCPAVSRIIGEQ